MGKYKKPLRSINDEIYDVDWSWEKRLEVEEAYDKFFATLPGLLRWSLRQSLK